MVIKKKLRRPAYFCTPVLRSRFRKNGPKNKKKKAAPKKAAPKKAAPKKSAAKKKKTTASSFGSWW